MFHTGHFAFPFTVLLNVNTIMIAGPMSEPVMMLFITLLLEYQKPGEIIMSQNETTKTTSQNVAAEVAESLQNSASDVRARVVATLVEREKAKRVDLLDKAMVKRQQLATELNKIRPTKNFQMTGGGLVEVEGTLTAEQGKQWKAAKEKLDKFDTLLESAFTTASKESFEKLSNAVGGKSEE